MSLYDKASLVQIPSGTKDGTLYSVLPANGNGDFTHVRASSATRVNKDGLIESVASGVPRLDYPLLDGVVQDCPALLLEPSRTNQHLSSEDFSGYAGANFTVVPNDATSPDGNVSADFIKENSGVNQKYFYKDSSITSGLEYTQSIFIKSNGTRYFQITGSTGFDTGMRVNFDLEVGEITLNVNANDASIIEYPDGWYRVSVTDTATTTTTGRMVYALIGSADAGRLASYSGVTTEGVYAWGAMLEVGDYPTSYIPTTTASVTRSADVCNGAGTSAEFNDTESSWFVELQGLAEDNTNKYISISDGGGSPYTNSLSIQYRNNGTLRIFHNGLDFADAIFVGGSSFDLTENHKIAIRFKENDMAVYIDGVSQSLSGSFVYQSISGLNTLRFEQPNAGNAFYGKVKQLMVFNEALTDAELATLTS
jgi:hypothetical protein